MTSNTKLISGPDAKLIGARSRICMYMHIIGIESIITT